VKKVIYTAQEEQALMRHLLNPELANDPYKWVMAVFPWGEQNKPLAHFKGPRKWQIKVLKRIARHIWEGKTFNLAQLLQLARVSGRGIGKSALVAWLVLWFLSTRIGATAIISANNEEQLRKTTFAEIMKWNTMALNSHWFEVVGITATPAKWLKDIVERDLHKGTGAWGAFGKLWSEDNPDGYAGAHNHEGMMVIFDEASGIPEAIWSVAKGFFTEPTPNRFWLAFSQGRRNSGTFYSVFHGLQRESWDTDSIDARDVEGTDNAVYEGIINEYGEDSDEARVEVYGRFPSNDDISFISPERVRKAIDRGTKDDKTAPIIIGIDPAGIGKDGFLVVVRQGMVILAIRRYSIEDTERGTMLGVDYVIDAIEEFSPDLVVIDETGLGIVFKHRLTELGYKVKGVNFAWKSKDPARYANKRAEMWDSVKKWLETATIPNDKRLVADLTGVRKKPTGVKNALILESKQEMRARKIPSPDSADALAVTFAYTVRRREGYNRSTASKPSLRRVSGRRGASSGATGTAWLGN
jgi:hypothetical protein